MIFRYKCKDLGLSCPFVVKGESVEDVVQKALEHVREKHTQDFNMIQTPAQVEAMVQSLTRATRIIAD
jgi:predicted small metal-binding protein